MIMAVIGIALDGEKQIARFGLARIRANIVYLRCCLAALDFRAARFGHKFQRTFIHKIILIIVNQQRDWLTAFRNYYASAMP